SKRPWMRCPKGRRPTRLARRKVTRGLLKRKPLSAGERGRCLPIGAKLGSVVILVAQVGDELLAHHPAERVLQLHELNEQIVLRIELGRGHRALEIEAEPLLDAREARALRQIEEE